MHIAINKAKTAAIITMALLMACVTLMAVPEMPAKAQEEDEAHGFLGGIGTTSSDIYGYPNLGPLPAGVTPHTTIDTIAYLSFRPNPIGVGQQLLVNVWTQPGTPNWMYMQGNKVTIQKPDGTTVVVGPFNSYLGDASAWFELAPDQVGTWKLKFEQPGTYLPAGQYVPNPGTFPQVNPNFTIGASIYYKPSSTDWQELTVQQDMVSSWPLTSLPTDYWTRPVNVIHREWYAIGGNYPWTGAYYYEGGRVLYASNYKYTAYVQAPNTAHIVWRRQGAIAGIIGGGEAYQYSLSAGGDTPSIIYAGRAYETATIFVDGVQTSVYRCYDLRTGQVYWERKDVSPTPTAILYETPQIRPDIALGQAGSGVTVYFVAISGGRLLKYNPLTGAVSSNISLPTGITSGTIYNNEWVLTQQTINATAGNYRLINWTMRGTTTNFTARIGTNITWPIAAYSAPLQVEAPNTVFDYDAGIAIIAGRGFGPPQGLGITGTGYASSFCFGHNITAANLLTGAIYYNIGGNETLVQTAISYSNSIVNRGKFATSTAGRQWICRDASTGKILWRSEQMEYPWGCWFPYNTASYDFNETKSAIIIGTYEGVYAIDWDDGKIIWRYTDANAVPFENPYDATPFYSSVTIADGKVYTCNGEHSQSQPRSRDWKLHCINATTGELLWKIINPMSPGAVADGYLTASNPYDGYMYVFGKGKSATTVTAPDVVVPKGTGVVIKGTVMDMSPGDQGSVTNPTASLDSPTKPGTVPCVSAASMSTLMEYLYMQHPLDGLWHNETITGVPVILTAIGSDGTVIDIGTTTTNGYGGTFGMAWTPPKEDTYTIMASFNGDDSYGSSMATTTVAVGPAQEPYPTPIPPEAPVDNTPLLNGILVAVIVAIIVGIVAILLALRKRQ